MRRSVPLALVAIISMLAACASGGAGAGGGSSSHLSSAPVNVERYARLLAMSDERRIDTALIQGILRSGSSAERRAAALAIGQVHASVLAPTLRALLADGDTTVAGNAAYSLGQLADAGSIAALSHALDAPPSVAGNAAWALGQIGEPARAAIVAGLAPAS
nr:HEAT repeat domain-containing protein [Gemmatimonadaceae bacterium]